MRVGSTCWCMAWPTPPRRLRTPWVDGGRGDLGESGCGGRADARGVGAALLVAQAANGLERHRVGGPWHPRVAWVSGFGVGFRAGRGRRMAFRHPPRAPFQHWGIRPDTRALGGASAPDDGSSALVVWRSSVFPAPALAAELVWEDPSPGPARRIGSERGTSQLGSAASIVTRQTEYRPTLELLPRGRLRSFFVLCPHLG